MLYQNQLKSQLVSNNIKVKNAKIITEVNANSQWSGEYCNITNGIVYDNVTKENKIATTTIITLELVNFLIILADKIPCKIKHANP